MELEQVYHGSKLQRDSASCILKHIGVRLFKLFLSMLKFHEVPDKYGQAIIIQLSDVWMVD